jgi:hypothetical protein
MFSFRRHVAVQAFFLTVSLAAFAQSSSSSSTPPQDQTQQPAATQNPGQQSVQARIRARREARRAQAIHDTYSHPYEVFVGAGYQWFRPGPDLQRNVMWSWDVAVSRYWSEKLGLTFDGRGYYGTTFTGLNFSNITKPAISHYDVLVGPTYRLRLRPRYSLAARVQGGVAMGNFTGDTNGFGSICPPGQACLLHSDQTTYAFAGSVIGEWNLSPNISLRLAPEYMVTGFGSAQSNPGFTWGIVYRFGKGF